MRNAPLAVCSKPEKTSAYSAGSKTSGITTELASGSVGSGKSDTSGALEAVSASVSTADSFGASEASARLIFVPEGAAAALASGSIVNNPVFDVSDAAEMTNRNATEDDIHLALAKHVPALSSPVGGMAVVLGERIENHDLNAENEYRNAWGRSDDSIYQSNWLHSDMKDMAYFYVYKLYNQLVEKGSLR